MSRTSAKAKSPFADEVPIGAPRHGTAGRLLKCACGCGRIADTHNWDTQREPASLRCFIEQIIKHAGAQDEAGDDAGRAAKAQRLADARAVLLGEE